MVDVPLTLGFFLGVLPAFAVMFLAYGSYERAFKDNILFVHLMGGGAAGLLMYLLEALLVAASVRPGGLLFGIAMAGAGFALLDTLMKAMALNRKSQQGTRAVIYYGGAFGMGYAGIFAFIHSMSDFPLWLADARGELLPAAVGVGVLAVALTALHF
ncbi:MAG: hypothetical protein LC624_11880, partial [Halobacteriales archaeon]|nr:hypothetical protein [Halobacteriales archaeon]